MFRLENEGRDRLHSTTLNEIKYYTTTCRSTRSQFTIRSSDPKCSITNKATNSLKDKLRSNRNDSNDYIAFLKEYIEQGSEDMTLETKAHIVDSIKKELDKRKPLKIHSAANATTIISYVEKGKGILLDYVPPNSVLIELNNQKNK